MADIPAPVSFPAPIGFPVPRPSPYFGTSLVDRPLATSGLIPLGAPTPYSPYAPRSLWARENALSMFSPITGGAVSAQNDPTKWTLDEATAQTDRAIARIAQVNPQLAEQLQQQRAGQAGGDTGGGFFDGLKNAVATIAGLPVIHQALDLLSRPFHIIPEIIADEENQGFFGNVAQALAGHSDKTMADVLEMAGVDNPVLRGVLGFGLDVLLDPVTWVTAGLGGLGRASVQATAGRVGLEASLSTERGLAAIDRLADAAGIAGRTVAETRALAFNDLWAGITGKTSKFFAHGADDAVVELSNGLRALNPDAAAGVLADFLRGADAEILHSAVAAADVAMRAAGAGSLRFGARTAEALGLPLERVEQVITGMRKAGTLTGDRQLYVMAKRAAALEGGLHIRVAFPFTPLRYVGPSLFPAFFGQGPFQGLRRFFAGMSGETRLRKMVEAGEASVKDLMTWWSPPVVEGGRTVGGFEALRRANPQVADRLGNGMLHAGNAFYSLSEQVGRVTMNFGNGFTRHLLRGGGLGEYMASSHRRATLSMFGQLEDEAWTLTDDSILRDLKGAGLIEENIQNLLPRHVGKSPGTQVLLHDLFVEVGKDGSRDALTLTAYFGDDVAQAGGVAAEYAARKAELEGRVAAGLLNEEQFASKLATEDKLYRDALQAEARLAENAAKDQAYLGMRILRRVFNNGKELNERYVGPMSDVRTPLENMTVINPEQAEDALTGAHGVFKGARWVPSDETVGRFVPGQSGFQHPELLTDATDVSPFRGLDLVEQQPGPAVAVAGSDLPQPWRSSPYADQTELMKLDDLEPYLEFPGREGGARPPGYFEDLVEDIRQNGIREPLLLDYNPTTRKASLTEGNHRFAAARQVGLEYVPVRGFRSTGGGPRFLEPQGAASLFPDKFGYFPQDFRPSQVGMRTVRDVHAEQLARGGVGALEESLAQSEFARRLGVSEHTAVVTASKPLLTLDEAVLRTSPALRAMGEGNAVFDRIEQQAEQMLDLFFGEAPAAAGKLAEKVVKKAPKRLFTTEGRAALRELGFDPDTLTPDMGEILLSPVTGAEARAAKKAQLMTMLAQQEGYDSFATFRQRPDGALERVTTVFHPDGPGLPPVKELNDAAPVSRLRGGYVPFDVTDEVRQALTPGISLEELRFLGPRTSFPRAKVRDTLFDKTVTEAESIIRAELADKNIVLADGAALIERDPLKLASDYVHGVARRAAQSQTDAAGQYLGTLGLTRNPHLGHAVGVDQWEAVFARGDKRLADQLARRGAYAVGAAERATRIMGVQVQSLRAKLANTMTRLERATQRFSADMTEVQELIESRLDQTELIVNPRKFERMKLVIDNPARYGAKVEEVVPNAWRVEMTDLTGITRRSYAVTTFDGTVVSLREVAENGVVAAYTHPQYTGAGYGSRALDAHWKDVGVKTKAQILAQIRKQAFSEEGARLNVSAARRHLPSGQAMKRAEDVVHQAEQAVDARLAQAREAAQAAERTIAEMKTRVADVRPAMVDVNATWAGFLPVNIFGAEVMKMPAYMALEMQRALMPFKSLNDFQRSWRRMLSWWKDWATWAVPGFHVRNNYGSMFNNWLGGVGLDDYKWAGRVRKAAWEIDHVPESARKWAGKEVPNWFVQKHGLGMYFTAGQPVYYEDIATLASNLGINASHGRAFAEARIGVEKLDEAVRGVRGFEKVPFVGKPYVRAMRGAGTMTENLHRTAAWFKGLRDSGGELASSRVFVMMRHGDYQDLSDWEYGLVRDLIPFYKWIRTNLPFQVHQLIENPGKLMAVLKAKEATWEAAGLDYGEDQYRVPEWLREGFSMPLPGSTQDAIELMTLDLPMNDLYMGAHEFVSSGLPLAAPFLESYVIGKSLFSDKPLTGKAVPAAPVWPVNTAINLVGHVLAPLGIGNFTEDGQYAIDEKLQNIVGIIPMASRFRHWLFADPDRAGLRVASLFSVIGGVGVRPIGEAEMTSNELSFYYSQVLPTIEQMRSLGINLPTTNDIEHLYGTYQQALTSVGLNPLGPPAGR